MAVDIGTLSAKVVADPSGFVTGLDRAAGMAKTWAGKVSGFFGIGLGTLGVGLIAHKMISTIKELENVSDAAAAAGVSVGDFMKITGRLDSEDTAAAQVALEKMSKALGELSTGSEEAKKKFLDVGLDPVELQALGAAGAVRKVAQAYLETDDAGRKSSIALTAFGKGMTSVIPAIDKLAASSSEAGGRFAGMTETMIADAARAKEAITTLENAWSGFIGTIAIKIAQLGPDLSDFWEAFTGSQPERKSSYQMPAEFFRRVEAGLAAEGKTRHLREVEARIRAAQQQGMKQDTDELEKQRKVHEKIDKLIESAAAASYGDRPAFMRKAAELRREIEKEFGGAEKVPADIRKDFGFLEQHNKQADVDVFSQSLSKLSEEMEKQAATFGMHGAEVTAWQARFDAAKLAAQTGWPVLEMFGQKLTKLDAGAKQAKEFDRLMALPTEGLSAFERMAEQIERLEEAFGGAAEMAVALAQAKKKINEEFDQNVAQLAAQEIRALATPLEQLAALQSDLGKAWMKPGEKQQVLGKHFLNVAESFKNLIRPVMEPVSANVRGSAAEMNSRARFEQSQVLGERGLEAEMVRLLKMMLDHDQRREKHEQKVGDILEKRLPQIKVAG